MIISLDNDVLSDILNDSQLTDRVVRSLNNSDHLLLISSNAHQENIAGKLMDRVVHRGIELAKLLRTGKVILLKDLINLVPIELDLRLSIKEKPFESKKCTRQLADSLANKAWAENAFQRLEESRTKFHEHKQKFYEREKQCLLDAKSSPAWNPSEVDSDLKNFTGPTKVLPKYEIGFGIVRLGYKTLDRKLYAARVMSGKAKASYVLANLFNLRYMINLLESNHGTYGHLQSRLPSDVHDIVNAASGGYADMFVTNDKKLRGLCEILRERGIIRFKCGDFKDFESALQPH